MDPIEAEAGETLTVWLPGVDIDSDEILYGATIDSSDFTYELDEDTGELTITVADVAGGMYSAFVGVSQYSNWDTQTVPIFVTPNAPTSVTLDSADDTGIADDDGVTQTDKEFTFTIGGIIPGELIEGEGDEADVVIPGAIVELYIDGTLAGTATAGVDETSVTITTDSSLVLADGEYEVTVKQTMSYVDEAIGNEKYTQDLVSPVSTFTLTVDTTAPVFTATPDDQTIPSGVLWEFDVNSEDETAGTVRYTLKDVPEGLTIEIDEDTGEISWTPDNTDNATYTIKVVATDDAGNETEASFDLTVDSPPVFETVADQTVDELQKLTFTVSATDPDDKDVTYALGDGALDGMDINATSGLFEWTPTEAQGDDETITVTITATDEFGSVSSLDVNITPTEVNSDPELATITIDPIDEHVEFTYDVSDNATDSDIPEQTLTYSLTDAPEGMTIDPDTGEITWTPGETTGGESFTFDVTVEDPDGASDTQEVTIEVNEIYADPVFSDTGLEQVYVVYHGESMKLDFDAVDPDGLAASIWYEIESGPDGMRINNDTGEVFWDVPTDHELAEVELVVSATEVETDGSHGASVLSTTIFEDGEPITFRVTGLESPGSVVAGLDPMRPGEEALFITGTGGNDRILITQLSATRIRVALNGVVMGEADTPNPAAFIYVNGGEGSDQITVDDAATLSFCLMGGNGNDSLRGGSGDDLIFGGPGRDFLYGGWDGDDIIVGGGEGDWVEGHETDNPYPSSSSDLLITTLTEMDAHMPLRGGMWSNAVLNIRYLAETWTSGESYAQRVATLTEAFAPIGTAADDPVAYEDGAIDRALGQDGTDWFIGTPGQDIFTRHPDEIVTYWNSLESGGNYEEDPNDPPVAADDELVVTKDTVRVIDPDELLDNDQDVDGDVFGITGVDDTGTDGTVEIDGDGNIVFTPDAGFHRRGRRSKYTISRRRRGRHRHGHDRG